MDKVTIFQKIPSSILGFCERFCFGAYCAYFKKINYPETLIQKNTILPKTKNVFIDLFFGFHLTFFLLLRINNLKH
ncbi:hypothetical protein COY07_05530 [Candidatus Peregrinibacteria bacterium CG_4_10_14_0_2_um_filter_43_11]|nr:MAG: hypothetical protein COY07_05530 [Candidatus Peregrinibacteria bacterium CG_4_10_14_0_2_um_filter_43_11]